MLFSEDFLHVADFLLDFAGDLFVSAAISQVGVADRFPALLFHFAFGFTDIALVLDFITTESPREAVPGGLFGRSPKVRPQDLKISTALGHLAEMMLPQVSGDGSLPPAAISTFACLIIKCRRPA